MLYPPKSQGIAMQGKHLHFHDRKKFLGMEATTISSLSFGFRSSSEKGTVLFFCTFLIPSVDY